MYGFVRLSALFLGAVAVSGCYVNRALVAPNEYAPKSAADLFFPPTECVCKPISQEEPYLPKQDVPYSQAEIIDIALKNNPDTTISWTAAKAAAARYAKSQARFLPNVDALGVYYRAREPYLDRDEDYERVAKATMTTIAAPHLRLAYTIFDFGQRRFSSEFSRYSLYFTNWTHNRTVQKVVQQVSNSYYNYLLQKTLHDLLGKDMETAQMTMNAVQEKKGDGANHTTDFLQAQTVLIQRQVDFEAQDQQVQSSLADLLNTMGISSDLEIEVQTLPDRVDDDFNLKSVSDLIEEAMELRPDLKANEARVRADDAVVNLAYSDFFPTLYYGATFGRTYFKRHLHEKNDWSSTFSLQIPLFSGLARINELKRAKADREGEVAQMRKTKLAITKEVRTTHSQVRVADRTLKKAREYLRSANQQYASALKKYKEDKANILDVVSAQTSLASARSSYAQANRGWYSALTNLVFAVGYYTFKPTKETSKSKGVEFGQLFE